MIGRLVILLIVANVAWAAWSQGWLRSIGLAPSLQTEPQQLERQLHPEALHIRPWQETDARAAPPPAVPAPAASAPQASAAPAPAPAMCLQAGPFDDKQIDAVRRAAAALPAGSWRVDTLSLPNRWMVYMGRFADADAVRAKRDELRKLDISTDRPGAFWEPGLSLGRYSSEDAAQRALTDLGRKGVRTARIVQERRDGSSYMLRLPAADAALRQQASSLRSALGERELRGCE